MSLVLALCAPVWGASILSFDVVSLGGYGGASAAFGLNASGVAAGVAALPSGTPAAFVSSGPAGVSNPGWVAGAYSSQANGINDAGQAVGTSYLPSGAQATVWQNGQATAIGSLGGGESYGSAINNAGVAAGSSTNADGQGHAFLYDGGWTDIGADLNMGWSAALDVSGTNQVAGYGEIAPGVFRGFVWANGAATQLGTFGGASSYAFGINASGTVAGHAQTASGASHAFLFDGTMHDLGTLGGTSSYAYDVNAAGWVVGYSWLPGNMRTHAFLFTGSGLFDLNLLLREAAGWELLEAYGINDAGQIAGAGLYGGQRMAFRLDPFAVDSGIATIHQPEPGTMTLMGFGLGLLVVGFWRRSRRR